jgi:4-amino-4-deoxy-L-arabinose transferase-like glycosyltransferase
MRLVRLAIWLATGLFVFLLFYPLVMQMFDRLKAGSSTVLP